jgi:uncharacterized membrane protein HdeD (DUF308 family)
MRGAATTSNTLQDTTRSGIRTPFGIFVLSYRVGSLTAVAVFVGVAFIFGGITQAIGRSFMV